MLQTLSKMNNERRKDLKEVLVDLQRFVDGKIPEAEAFAILNEVKIELGNCLFDERESRDNLMEFIPSGPKVDKADKTVYALEDADEELKMVLHHLDIKDAEYQDLINVYIKSVIENIKKAIGK